MDAGALPDDASPEEGAQRTAVRRRRDDDPSLGAIVVVDVNEPPDIPALLEARGVVVERRRLAPADYVVGPVALERKAVSDFHASMTQKRLFEQLTRLKETYATPALLLEGDVSFFLSLASPRASFGALLSVSIDLDIPIVPSPTREASAEILELLALRVGRSGGRTDVRYKPKLLGPHAEQKFVAQGLPGIGDVVSENLLSHFGTLRRLFAANERELLRVPGIGKGRAEAITELLERRYEGVQRRL